MVYIYLKNANSQRENYYLGTEIMDLNTRWKLESWESGKSPSEWSRLPRESGKDTICGNEMFKNNVGCFLILYTREQFFTDKDIDNMTW